MVRFSSFNLLNFLLVVCVCNWSGMQVVGEARCRTTTRNIGYCTQLVDCPSLTHSWITKEMLNPKDCENSYMRGVVVCCQQKKTILRPMTPSTTITTTKPTTTTAATTKTTPTKTERTTTKTTTTTIITPETKPNTFDLRHLHNSETMNLHADGLALLNKNNCGKDMYGRIPYGQDVLLGEFPWMAMLLYTDNARCGGSVITDRFVLTAHHCILPTLRLVRLGEHKISTEMDCVLNNLCVNHRDFGIEKTIGHPQYNDVQNYKDIALIKLNNTINFRLNKNIKPLCLQTKPELFRPEPNSKLIIAGWGRDENEQPVDVLQKGELIPESLDICKKTYPRYTVDESRLCHRSGINNTVSCRGDSGSPLFWRTSYRTKGGYSKYRYAQIGLISLGYNFECGGLTSVPFLAENVTNSLEWITHNILY